MFRGDDHFAIQGAVDYVARLGGGRVRLLPGTYTLRNAVFLPSEVTLTGSGPETVLSTGASLSLPLIEDCDWCDWSIKVTDTSGFRVGDGITIYSERIDGGSITQVSLHTIVGIEDGRLHLDSLPRMDHWMQHNARVVSTHSLLESRCAHNVRIENLTLDGNAAENETFDGNYGAAIFLHDTEKIHINNIHINDYNGDAISWQICHDVTVENCTISNITQLGLHPGSGSQRPVMRGNTINHCNDGIFWCWDVRHGIAENNVISHCKRHGISTGHRDTDNVIRGNKISHCAETGIYFRPERSAAKTSHRVLVEANTIEIGKDSPQSIGISVVRGVEDVILKDNRILLPSSQTARAIVIAEEAIRPVSEGNEIVTYAA